MPNTGQMNLNSAQMNLNSGQADFNSGPMDLRALMNARLQGAQGVPAYGTSDFGSVQGAGSGSGTSPSVWASQIPEDFRNTKAIGNIFGNFGNVMKIKFSKKKPEGALVQMQDPSQAVRCCKLLHNTKLPGGKITVRPSRMDNIVIYPHEDADTAKDFSQGFEHRYRDVNSKFAQTCLARVGSPTPVLMVNNVPEDKMSELKAYIIESGYTIENFREGKKKGADENKEEESSKKKRTSFVFVELSSTEEAVSAVARLHNTAPSSIGEGRFRRLGFAFTSNKEA